MRFPSPFHIVDLSPEARPFFRGVFVAPAGGLVVIEFSPWRPDIVVTCRAHLQAQINVAEGNGQLGLVQPPTASKISRLITRQAAVTAL